MSTNDPFPASSNPRQRRVVPHGRGLLWQHGTEPYLTHWRGLAAAEAAAAITSVLGLLVTIFMLPETSGKSLEELSSEPSTAAERAA